MFNKTKIICTIGPSSSKEEIIKELILEGVNAFRLNFSHGDYSQHKDNVEKIRKSEAETGKSVTIIQDLQGPKIRVGKLQEKNILLKDDEQLIITSKEIKGNHNIISTTYKDFCKDLKPKQRILIDDGLILLNVEKKIKVKNNYQLLCRIIKGGILREHKGINLPDTKLSLPAITKKDLKDIDLGKILGIDMIALSFVRKACDILFLKKLLKKKGFDVPVIAKIERPEAISEIDKIIKISDAIMIARGDLGVELSPEEVPLLQKIIIKKCNEHLKPVITATQMLESMVKNRIPTRAEASDVANAILDGTDCVMLSAETSIGIDPVNAVKMMSKIIQKTESIKKPQLQNVDSINNTLGILCKSATDIADEMNIKTIITISNTGKSPLYLSNHRVSANIFVITPNPKIFRFNNIVWGVKPCLYEGLIKESEIINFIINQISNEFNKKIEKAIFIYNKSENKNESADTISIIDLRKRK